jgi:hypothetical protein
LLWFSWEATGLDAQFCPWRNPREMKKHRPKKLHIIEAARKQLEEEKKLETH